MATLGRKRKIPRHMNFYPATLNTQGPPSTFWALLEAMRSPIKTGNSRWKWNPIFAASHVPIPSAPRDNTSLLRAEEMSKRFNGIHQNRKLLFQSTHSL
jgi:hypothetical protein